MQEWCKKRDISRAMDQEMRLKNGIQINLLKHSIKHWEGLSEIKKIIQLFCSMIKDTIKRRI